LSSKKGIATATIRLGVVQLRNGNYDKAIGDFLDALKISEETDDKFGLMEANYNISWAYLDQHKYEPALQYLKIAEQFNQLLPFSNISLNIYNHLGIIYTHSGEFKKAKHYLEKGIQLSGQPEYQGLNINMINNLANVYSKEGFPEKAISLQEEALSRSRKIGNYLRELQSLLALSKTYGEKEPQKAIFYLKQAVLLAREKKVPRQEIRYLQNITDLYKSQGNYKEALLMKERQYVLADSFFYKKMSQNIEELKAEYELSKSNAKIKELNYINNKHQLELKNSTLIRNVTFAGFAVLLIILGLLYNQYRIKQRNNKEISRKNFSLQHLVEEKEWLLKEVHHRVKNNLQMVMSLLNAHSAYLGSDEAIMAIRDSQHRMQAMALIHQKLYQSENIACINMPAYINELVNYLQDSFNAGSHIRFERHIEPLTLDVAMAVPLGLILNEAISNAIKYAFPGNRNGSIVISINRTDDTHFLLTIADDGVGLPANFDIYKSNSLGINLMQGLSKQLGCRFKIVSDKGVTITIEFTEDKLKSGLKSPALDLTAETADHE
jgi:two-component sensor histidine kinase